MKTIKATGHRWIRLTVKRSCDTICVKWGCSNWYAIKDQFKESFDCFFDGETKLWEIDLDDLEVIKFWANEVFGSENVSITDASSRSRKSTPPPPRSRPVSSHHETLFLAPNAPVEVIKAAYKALAIKHHPDKGGDHNTMVRINAAYEALMSKVA